MRGFLQKYKFGVALLASITLMGIFLLPFCDLLYDCGCTYPWAGDYQHCNIHTSGMPDCPWCVERSPVLMSLPFVAIVLTQAFAIRYFQKRQNASLLILIAMGMLAFLVIGASIGFVYKLVDGYPYFLID